MEKLKKRRLHFPDTAFLLFVIIFVVAALTYLMPAGLFDRILDEETGRTLVQSGTYSTVASTPTTLVQLLTAFMRGLIRASDIIAFVFVVGGSFGVVSRTGAITAGLNTLIVKLEGKEFILGSVVMTAFAACGATFGMAEESLPFVVILTLTALKMGYDPIVGVSMVVVGIYCGYSAGPLNPFNTGIAQGIAELPTFSGIGLRVILMIGALAIAIFLTLRHGKKYKDLGIDNTEIMKSFNAADERPMEKKDTYVLSILTLTIVGLIFGVIKYGWYFDEIAALFVGMAFVVGLVQHGRHLEKIALDFIEGAKEMTIAALYIGLSRAILVIMEDGQIMDTLVYYMSLPLSNLSSIFAAWGMYISQGFINFFIPSSTGQAVVVMPILSPLSDIIGVNRQTAVLAYQCGDGFWNMITPTHSVLMASLGLAKVSFGNWFKFALPLVLAWTAWVFVVLGIATAINYGPF